MQRSRLGIVVVLSGLSVVSGCSSNKDPAPDEPPKVAATPDSAPTPHQPAPSSVDPPKVDPPKADPPAVDPDARRRLAADDTRGHFGVGPGYLYWCDGKVVRGIPKNGDTEISIGACEGAFQFMGDHHGIYYCRGHGLYRGMPGNEKATQVASQDCILGAVDNTDVYFIVPGFEGIPDPGLYKLARSGGDPTRVLPTRKGEQIAITLDGGDIWITSYFAGTIQKLAKSGGKPVTVISGQKSPAGIAADDRYLYWIVEQSAEVRRRSKRGGPIETVGTKAGSRVIAYGKAVYWADGVNEVLVGEDDPVPTGRVMRLALGAKAAQPIETELLNPEIAIDADGLYISELRKPGVLFIPTALLTSN